MKCFNCKVIAALAAIGIGIYALAPGTALAAETGDEEGEVAHGLG